MMRLRRLVVAISAVSLCAIAACSGTRPPPPVHHTSPTIPHATVGLDRDANRPAPAPPIPGAKQGGVLTVLGTPLLGTELNFDPTAAWARELNSILSGLVIRSLTQYVYDPGSKQMILVPDLATDLGRPNRDFTVWQFTIRPDVKFENGREVTAADVKYGIERSLDRKTFAIGPDYSNVYFQAGDTYQGPYTTPGPYRGATVHGNVITIRMSRPFPDMSYWAAFPAMSAIPAGQASDPATYGNHPWSTGPYMFKEYHRDHSLVLVKNPQWDPNTDPGRHQYVDEIDFRFDADQAEIDQQILTDTGEAQSSLTYSNILPVDYPAFAQQSPDRLAQGAKPCTHMWAPDNRTVTDIRVRQALAYAFPYHEDWAAGDLIPNVTELPATNIAPPGTPGRVAYNPLPGHTPGSTDPAKARRLLVQAGELGYPVRFPYDKSDPSSVAEKNVLVTAFRAGGFNPQPVASTDPKPDLNLQFGGWCTDWNSGSALYPPLFSTSQIHKVGGSGSNYGAFSAPAIDHLLASIPARLLTEQPAAWNSLDRLIQMQYFPVIVTGYGAVALPHGSKVHSDFIDVSIGLPTWKDIWLG